MTNDENLHGFVWPLLACCWLQNIWHSTLRSKKLKSRSLLRAYAREVQERGDSAAARLEAFRIAFRQTRGNDDMEADPTAAKASGNGRLHDPASPDDDIYGLHADMSPRHNPHFADSAEGTHVGKKALMKHSPSGETLVARMRFPPQKHARV